MIAKRKRNKLQGLLFILLFIATSAVNAQISGIVYRDFNANGIMDATSTYTDIGISGITIKAYNSANTLVGTTTSATAGTYSFIGLTLPLRIEFTGFATGDYTAPAGSNNSSSIQFYSASSTTANFGINYPNDYTQANPQLVTSLFTSTTLTGYGASFPDLMKFNYWGNTLYIGQSGYTAPTQITDHQHLGAVYGIAYARQAKKVYTAAVLRRHVPFGPLGIGGIYQVDASTNAVTNWLDISTLSGINVGTDTRNQSDAANAIATANKQNSYDAAAFPLIGKSSLGDIEISDDGTVLYVVNLYQQTLIAINVSTKALIGSYSISASALGLATPQSDFRPWGLKYFRGKLYVGVVATAQTTQTATDLKGYVLQFDPANTGAGFTNYFSFPLNYTREQSTNWNPWNQNSYLADGSTNDPQKNPQPILSNIEFDVDGSLLLGLMDRHGMMFSSSNFPPDPTATATATTNPELRGDMLRACNVSGTLAIEGQTGCSYNITYTGGGEFYDDIRQNGSGAGNFKETTNGALAFLPGSKEIVTTSSCESGSTENGISWYNNTNGSRNRAYMIYDRNTDMSQGKGTGLGDIELLADAAPIEIGNRVWLDTDMDGIQDAGEAGISGVTVQLVSFGGSIIATATTDANGNYYFSSNPNGTTTSSAIYNITSLTAITYYTVRIPNAQGASKQSVLGANILTLTDAGSGANQDFLDNDASLVGNNADRTFITGNAGENNHTYDFGFTSCTKPNAGIDQAVCAGACATLTGTNLTTGTWTAMTGNPTGAALGGTTAGVASACFSSAASGTFSFIYTVGTCTDTMNVTVNSLPTIVVGTVNNICQNATNLLIPYSSTTNSPNQYNITWNTATTNAGVTNAGWVTLPSSPITITNIPNTTGSFGGSIAVRNTTTGCVSAATTTICNTVAENGNLTLTATSGTITAIAFASYGTPTGSCGSFATSSCNASTSVSVVQAACVGNKTCTVAATNGVFGDPCVGTVKRLYVEATVTNNFSFNVNALPTVAANTGTALTYVTGTTTLSNATSSGVWSSGTTSIATINSSGVVTGVTVGTSTISYTVTNANSCSSNATTVVTVNPRPNG